LLLEDNPAVSSGKNFSRPGVEFLQMLRSAEKLVVVALAVGVAMPISAQTRGAGKSSRTKPHPAAVRQQAPAPQVAAPSPVIQEPPPVPLRPEQMPPTSPQVTLQDNQLTIVADNSTLSSVLAAVRARTGARLEMPPDVASDRVAVRLGPGDPRDVVSALLQGSRFDYILLGSETDPDALSQIILTRRTGPAGAAPAMASSVPGVRPTAVAPPPPPPPMPEEEETAEPEPEPAPQPQPQAPAVVSPMTPPLGRPEIAPTAPAQEESQTPGQPSTAPQVKTPEQLLQELQRMRQQQQQNQQPQPENPQNPPPQ
jgi:hypothetical protein